MQGYYCKNDLIDSTLYFNNLVSSIIKIVNINQYVMNLLGRYLSFFKEFI